MRITTVKVLGLVAALAVAGCGGDEAPVATGVGAGPTTSTGDATTSTTVGSPTTTAASTAGGIDLLEDADTDAKSGPDGATAYGQLVDVAIGRHEGFDRVVFSFRDDGVPLYRVEYVESPITEDGSGEVLDVPGEGYLFVRMEPASAYDMQAGDESYTGPDRLEGAAAGTSEVQEVVKTGDFEAVLGWVIGLADVVDFRVDTLTNPGRIVIDVRNH